MADDKETLRTMLRLRRRIFVERMGAARLQLFAIAIAPIALKAAGDAQAIAAYLGNGREVDAMPSLTLACERGQVTALPHIGERGGMMRFLRWRPGDELVPGPYGVAQPRADCEEIAPEAILSPLVGFDRSGNRLGQGGGFYDRAFVQFPDAMRIGLAWSVQEARTVPVDSWDQPLHAVITEREWIEIA